MSVANTNHDAETDHTLNGAEQYLTFIVNKEEYGVDIQRVQGIQGWESVTPIPNAPPQVLGLINLRGAVVPVVDLRKRFGLDSIPFGPTTVVIIVRIENQGRDRIIGMVVDAVSEVYDVAARDIQPKPEFGGAIETEFICGIATMEQKMVILLDADRLLRMDDASFPEDGEAIQAVTPDESRAVADAVED